ncbi:MAG: nuclear transport factor 2 family protein [Bacteroidetes bacterium]|nr:nuclear transport factor 2 family protein [Bacteroidota bacterium]
MKRCILLCYILFSSLLVWAQEPKQEIAATLQAQTSAWNRGNLEGFMQGYWQSDSLLFIGKSGLTWGWQQTLDNYKRGYPSPEAMGKLHFNIQLMKPLEGGEAWLVVGKWHLSRSIGDLEGHFSLVWERKNNEWVIVADHSS